VKKKFFSLIRGDKLHAAPKTKVIPAKEFSSLMNASEVLEEVQKDAEAYKKNVVTETEKWKIEAEQSGFEEGFKAWAEAVSDLEGEVKRVQDELQRSLVPVVLAAAKKIVAKELEHPETIVGIVSNGLKAVSQHKKVAIYVNKKDLEAVETSRPRLKEIFEHLEALSIRESSDIEQGSYKIESEVGIINGDLNNQWLILERALEKVFKKKEQ